MDKGRLWDQVLFVGHLPRDVHHVGQAPSKPQAPNQKTRNPKPTGDGNNEIVGSGNGSCRKAHEGTCCHRSHGFGLANLRRGLGS